MAIALSALACFANDIDGSTRNIAPKCTGKLLVQRFNVESSPLEARINPNWRSLLLLNRSPGHISSYRLGCIRERPDMKVLRSRPIVRTDLEVGKALVNSISLYTEYMERCVRDTGKLTVVEVRFRDGSIWKIK